MERADQTANGRFCIGFGRRRHRDFRLHSPPAFKKRRGTKSSDVGRRRRSESIRFQWHSVNQFLPVEIPTALSSKLVLRDWSSQFLSSRCRPGRCGSRVRGCWRQMVLLLLIVVAPDNTRVDRGDPGITVLSIGYRPLGSRPRAAGWSAATSCFDVLLPSQIATLNASTGRGSGPTGRRCLRPKRKFWPRVLAALNASRTTAEKTTFQEPLHG